MTDDNRRDCAQRDYRDSVGYGHGRVDNGSVLGSGGFRLLLGWHWVPDRVRNYSLHRLLGVSETPAGVAPGGGAALCVSRGATYWLLMRFVHCVRSGGDDTDVNAALY